MPSLAVTKNLRAHVTEVPAHYEVLKRKPAKTELLCDQQQTTPHFVSVRKLGEDLEFGAFRPDDFPERAEKARTLAMEPSNGLQMMPFKSAAEVWLDIHKEDIGERTYKDYLFYIRTLGKTFNHMLLSQIHLGHVIEYRRTRQKTAGAWCINHEINTLKQIMQMAGLWDLIEKHYKPMKIKDSGPPRVLTVEEEEKFFRVVALAVRSGEKPEWEMAYLAASLTNNTTAHGIELRRIQLKHIQLDHIPPLLLIVSNKTDFRPRAIPLNSVAKKQVERLLERAKKRGSWKPDHYLFPFRIRKGEYNPDRMASPFFIRSAFRSMRRVLGPGFEWFKPSTLRNQCFTKLFESGAADETVISIGGHGAIKMSRYYSRIRATAKAEALEKIAPQPAEASKRAKGESA